jgi:nucleotide-binding universal stress UspA family protein
LGEVKLYPNECVERIIAFIPRGHIHLRLAISFCDGRTIVLHEATVAGIVRAYASVALHPTRRAIELRGEKLAKRVRKLGYAEWQLLETGRGEDEVLEEGEELLGQARS